MSENLDVRLDEQKTEEKRPNWFLRFLRWLFPWKGDSVKTIVFKCIFLCCIIAFLISGGLLADHYLKEYEANNEYLDAQTLMSDGIANPGQTVTTNPLPLPEGYRDRFNALYQVNQDITGWVKIDGTRIDYPVVHTQNNDYYLNHTFYKNYNPAGTPFLDYRCDFSIDNMSTNSLVYAHNLNSGAMFQNIVNYKNVSYYKEHPLVSYDTVYEDYDWKIVGMFFTNADMSLNDSFAYHMFINKSSDEEFYRVLNEAMQRSFFTTGVDVNANDKLLMLSTCDNAYDNSRLVLVARMVRDGEGTEVDVSKAQQNPNQYLPQNYIDKAGGTYREFDKNYQYYKPE